MWIGQAFNGEILPQENKKGGTGNRFSGSFAGRICLGKLDRITKLIIDEEIVWTGTLDRGLSEYVDVTVAERGTFRIYWGTETATVDPNLAELATPSPLNPTEIHPAYRGIAMLIADRVIWGNNRPSVPVVQVVGFRAPTMPEWWTPPVKIGIGVNLPCIVYELLTHPRNGLGMDPDLIDQASFLRVGAICEREGIGLSPVLTERESLRAVLVKLAEHVGAFPRTGPDGKLYLEIHRDIPDTQWLRYYDENSITSAPEWEPGDPAAVSDSVAVVFTDSNLDYQKNSVTQPSAAAADTLGFRRTMVAERLFLTSAADAQAIAQSTSAQESAAWANGSITVRASKLQGLREGDPFRFSWALHGIQNLVARAVTITLPTPGAPEVTIDWEEDRGWLNRRLADPSEWQPPSNVDLTSGPATYQRLWVLPTEFGKSLNQTRMSVAVLASRNNRMTNQFWAWIKYPGGSYARKGGPRDYILHGTLLVALDHTTDTEDGGTRIEIQFDGVDRGFFAGSSTSSDMSVLMGDEMVLLYDSVQVSAGRYAAWGKRAQNKTAAQDHVVNSEVWVFSGGDIKPIEVMGSPPSLSAKCQPMMIGAVADLSECPVLTVDLGGPPLDPANLSAFSDPVNPTYSTGEDILLTWDFRVDKDADIWASWGITPSPEDLPAAKIQFYTTGYVLKQELELDPGATSYTWHNADLITALGSEVSFIVRLYALRFGHLSPGYVELKIIKV